MKTKRILSLLITVSIILAFIGCATQPKKVETTKTVSQPTAKKATSTPKKVKKPAESALPKFVLSQSKKNWVPPASWKKFDKSGKVKFLQVQTTAPASPAGSGSKLDGSIGERLVEIKVDPSVGSKVVKWNLKNSGKSTVWVVAADGMVGSLPVAIAPGKTVSITTNLDKDNYTYIVVDNEGGKKTTLSISAKCGDVKAKTTRGKSMKVVWF